LVSGGQSLLPFAIEWGGLLFDWYRSRSVVEVLRKDMHYSDFAMLLLKKKCLGVLCAASGERGAFFRLSPKSDTEQLVS